MKIPKLITLNGLKRKRKGKAVSLELAKALHAGKLVYIFSGQWQQYWGPNGSGYTPYTPEFPKANHSVAGAYSWEDALERTWHCGPEKQIKFEFIDTAALEEAAIRSAANMGAPKFDRIESSPGGGQTYFYDGDRLAMIIDMPYEQFKEAMSKNLTKDQSNDTTTKSS